MPLPVKSLMGLLMHQPKALDPASGLKEQFLGGMPWKAGRLLIKPDA